LISLIALSFSLTDDALIFSKFQNFIKENNKNYNNFEEFQQRFKAFKENLLNLSYLKGLRFYKVGLNKFSDLTPTEFKKQYLTLKTKESGNLRGIMGPLIYDSKKEAPEVFDWRDEGAVGQIKDQGSCGSCWAFSAVANIEGIYYIKNKVLGNFSEQQLIDCDTLDQGCNGGFIENSFDYILKNGGIMLTRDYPYIGKNDTCKFSSSQVFAKITGVVKATSTNESDIKRMLHQTGPLSVFVNAEPFQFYQGGILDLDYDDCYPKNLNHAATLVGYGKENGKDFWVVKNSWGRNWGENGYIRLARGKGLCGIHLDVSSVTIN